MSNKKSSGFCKGKEFLGEKYPLGLQKLEARGFRVFQKEEIYTEKMITLSNVSLCPRCRRDIKDGHAVLQLWCYQIISVVRDEEMKTAKRSASSQNAGCENPRPTRDAGTWILLSCGVTLGVMKQGRGWGDCVLLNPAIVWVCGRCVLSQFVR